jgi:hypothetical protein
VEGNFRNVKEYTEGLHSTIVSMVDPGYQQFKASNAFIYEEYQKKIRKVFGRARDKFSRQLVNKMESYAKSLTPINRDGYIVTPLYQILEAKTQLLPQMLYALSRKEPTASDLEWYSVGPWTLGLKKVFKLEELAKKALEMNNIVNSNINNNNNNHINNHINININPPVHVPGQGPPAQAPPAQAPPDQGQYDGNGSDSDSD